MVTYLDSVVRYYVSNMILHIDSDAVYLVAPRAKKRIVGYYYLSDFLHPLNFLKDNAPVHVVCELLRHVFALAAKFETADRFFNVHNIIPLAVSLLH